MSQSHELATRRGGGGAVVRWFAFYWRLGILKGMRRVWSETRAGCEDSRGEGGD